MTSGRKLEPQIVANIQELAARGLGPAAIVRELERSLAYRDDLPDIRTVQRYVKAVREGNAGEQWTLEAFEPSSSPFVLDVLGAVLIETAGRVTTLTRGVASWIESIHAAAPDLDPWLAYRLARLYASRSEKSSAATDLDHFLALAPWRSDDAARRYELALANGWITAAPIALNFNSRVVVAAGQLESRRTPPNVDPAIWDALRDEIPEGGNTLTEGSGDR